MEFRLTRRQKIIQYPRLWYFLSTATVQMVLERKALAWDLLRYLQNDFNEVKIIQDEKLYTLYFGTGAICQIRKEPTQLTNKCVILAAVGYCKFIPRCHKINTLNQYAFACSRIINIS